jgi:hypothetical protein
MSFLALQQGHRTAAEVGPQTGHQALQAHRLRQVGNQVGEQKVIHG